MSGGVSNVSFSFRGNDAAREAIHTVFLYHAIKAGMTMGIVNAGMVGVYDDLAPELRERVEDVVLNRRSDAAERLIEIAESAKGAARDESSKLAWRGTPEAPAPVGQRLAHALIHEVGWRQTWLAMAARFAARSPSTLRPCAPMMRSASASTTSGKHSGRSCLRMIASISTPGAPAGPRNTIATRLATVFSSARSPAARAASSVRRAN